MAKKVNLPLDKLVARRDFHSHVALEFYRGDKWSEYIAFDPNGVQKFRVSAEKFEQQYNKVIDSPLERVALTFLRSLKSAYLPGDGVAEIILEIFTMAATNNTELTTLDTKSLVEVYNKLATAAGKPELKSFKEGKTKLLAKIEALQAEVSKPTAKQSAAKVANAAKAEKRLDGLKALKESKVKDAKPVASKKPTLADKLAADKPIKAVASKNGATKKPGIGAFCMNLIKAGKNNADVLAAAQKEFPDAKTSASSVAWYRNKLKSDGDIA